LSDIPSIEDLEKEAKRLKDHKWLKRKIEAKQLLPGIILILIFFIGFFEFTGSLAQPVPIITTYTSNNTIYTQQPVIHTKPISQDAILELIIFMSVAIGSFIVLREFSPKITPERLWGEEEVFLKIFPAIQKLSNSKQDEVVISIQ